MLAGSTVCVRARMGTIRMARTMRRARRRPVPRVPFQAPGLLHTPALGVGWPCPPWRQPVALRRPARPATAAWEGQRAPEQPGWRVSPPPEGSGPQRRRRFAGSRPGRAACRTRVRWRPPAAAVQRRPWALARRQQERRRWGARWDLRCVRASTASDAPQRRRRQSLMLRGPGGARHPTPPAIPRPAGRFDPAETAVRRGLVRRLPAGLPGFTGVARRRRPGTCHAV